MRDEPVPDPARRVVLHLGMHKTGSSSIQETFRGYRDARIEYAALGRANHSHLLASAFDPQARPSKFGTPDRSAHDPVRRAGRKRLHRAIQGTSRSLILSAEDLWTFPTDEACQSLVAFLRRRVPEVEALVYLRAPEAYATSAFQQRVQKGLSRLDPAGLVPPYRERAERWARALGREPTLVPFHPGAFRRGDLLGDFAHRLGLDPAWVAARRRVVNQSLSAEATALLFLLSRADGRPDSFGPGARVRGRLVRVLRGFGSRRFAIAPEVLAPALAARAEDLAWLEDRVGPFPRRPPGRDVVLFASDEDVLALAGAQEAELARFLARLPLAVPGGGEGALGLLRALRGAIASEEARIAAAAASA